MVQNCKAIGRSRWCYLNGLLLLLLGLAAAPPGVPHLLHLSRKLKLWLPHVTQAQSPAIKCRYVDDSKLTAASIAQAFACVSIDNKSNAVEAMNFRLLKGLNQWNNSTICTLFMTVAGPYLVVFPLCYRHQCSSLVWEGHT